VHGAIREAGMTIKGVGEASHIPARTMTRSINGERCFDFDELAKIGRVLGLTVSEIVARAERILDKQVA
jgi:plasmid maintenance system antidote protein VapI